MIFQNHILCPVRLERYSTSTINSLYIYIPRESFRQKFWCHSGKNRFFVIAAWFTNCGVIPQKAFSRVNKRIQRVNLLQIFMALMAQLEPTFLGRGLLPTPHALLCTCLFSSSTLILFRQVFFFKEFWPSCKTCTQGKHVRRGFPSVFGVSDCGVFWCDYGVFGCECGVFPRAPKKLIFKGCQHWQTGLI